MFALGKTCLITILMATTLHAADTPDSATDSCESAEATPPNLLKREALAFRFDARPWEAGYSIETDKEILIEYVLPDESVDSWTELVTTRLFKGAHRSSTVPDVFAYLEKVARDACAGAQWLTLISGTESIVYIWSNERCSKKGEAEYEIARLFLGDAGIHRISYACRDKKKFEAARDFWLETFLNTIPRQPGNDHR